MKTLPILLAILGQTLALGAFMQPGTIPNFIWGMTIGTLLLTIAIILGNYLLTYRNYD